MIGVHHEERQDLCQGGQCAASDNTIYSKEKRTAYLRSRLPHG